MKNNLSILFSQPFDKYPYQILHYFLVRVGERWTTDSGFLVKNTCIDQIDKYLSCNLGILFLEGSVINSLLNITTQNLWQSWANLIILVNNLS